jgi:hypothetical protein
MSNSADLSRFERRVAERISLDIGHDVFPAVRVGLVPLDPFGEFNAAIEAATTSPEDSE